VENKTVEMVVKEGPASSRQLKEEEEEPVKYFTL